MANLKERVKNNELNCDAGAKTILYSLAECGVLKDVFSNWASGAEPTEGEDLKKYNDAIFQISESILMFNDDIKDGGQIL